MSHELVWRLNTVAWALIATGCLVWGTNAVILALIRRRQDDQPVFGSVNPWRWTWSTTHGLKDLGLAVTGLSVVVAKTQNGPGPADVSSRLIVLWLTTLILWMCIARWTHLQWDAVRGRPVDGRTP